MEQARLIKIDRNGSKHWEGRITCDRCQGRGIYCWGAMISDISGVARPQFAGTCFKCGGSGWVIGKWIERTPEYQAKLDAKRAEKRAKAEEERQAREAERAAERAAREAERAAREAEIAARKARSQYVGTEGQRLTIEATVEKVIGFERKSYGGFGTESATVYKLRDREGNALVWITSGTLNTIRGHEAEEGEQVTITATVKKHSEYDGERQTELSRVKVS